TSLEEMVATYSAFDEGVRALLQPASGEEHSCAVLGVVADTLEADPQYERAVEAFLGERLQYVLTFTAEEAVRHLRYLETTAGGGPRHVLPRAEGAAGGGGQAARAPGGGGGGRAVGARAAERVLPRQRAARGGHPRRAARRAGGGHAAGRARAGPPPRSASLR